MAYTTNEREQPGVGVWLWDTEKGELKTAQDIVTQPNAMNYSEFRKAKVALSD